MAKGKGNVNQKSDTLLKDKEQEEKVRQAEAQQYARLLDVMTTQSIRVIEAIEGIYAFSTQVTPVLFYRQVAQYFTSKADDIAAGKSPTETDVKEGEVEVVQGEVQDVADNPYVAAAKA